MLLDFLLLCGSCFGLPNSIRFDSIFVFLHAASDSSMQPMEAASAAAVTFTTLYSQQRYLPPVSVSTAPVSVSTGSMLH